MDIATILGIVIAIGSILGGQALEGGHIGSVLQLTAFIIVMGGTIGACCIQNPLPVVIRSLTSVTLALITPPTTSKARSRKSWNWPTCRASKDCSPLRAN